MERHLSEASDLKVGDVVDGPVRIVDIKADANKFVVTVELAQDTVVLPRGQRVWKRS